MIEAIQNGPDIKMDLIELPTIEEIVKISKKTAGNILILAMKDNM